MANLKALHKNVDISLEADSLGFLETRAVVEDELEHASARGRSFIWQSANTNIDAGDTRLFVKNTGSQFLVLSRIIFNPANVACQYDVGIGALTTAPTGTVITATNMNEFFTTQSPDADSFDDETAVATGSAMFSAWCSTTASNIFDLQGVILGKGHYIQVNQVTTATSGSVSIWGHYEDELI